MIRKRLSSSSIIGRIDWLLHLRTQQVSVGGTPRSPARGKTWEQQRNELLAFNVYRDALYADLRKLIPRRE